MRLALYQPDIPQNTGAILRLAACFGLGVDIIEPCGFAWDDRKLRRAAMDYIEEVSLIRHPSWDSYIERRENLAPSQKGRLVLLSTKAENLYHDFQYRSLDTLLLGQESAGVPEEIHSLANARIRIPIRTSLRSLNVAMAAAIVATEALRQEGFLFDA